MSKLYVWVHSRLDPTYKGIQATHVLSEMVETYLLDPEPNPEIRKELADWIVFSKTMVVFQLPSHRELNELSDFFDLMPEEDAYPHGYFNEEDLDNCTTAVGIVLDSSWDKETRQNLTDLNEWERLLLSRLNASVEAR